ncbi:MAG: DnaA N-terminal domain-containing protein, partial [Planctomycetota bacterium]
MTEALAKENWNRVLDDLQNHVGKDAYKLWLRHTLVVKLEPAIVEIGVPSLAVSDWLEEKFSADIIESIDRVVGYRPSTIKYSVNGHLFRQFRKHEENA